MTIPAYPLQWPAGWKRSTEQAFGRFGKRTAVKSNYSDNVYQQKKQVTVADAVSRIRTELDRMGLRDDDIVISTNLKLRLDGLPRSDQREPDDSGAAVYWVDKTGATRCMAIDRYTRIADNLAAIAATLDAMRAIERHGGAEILDRAFTGFKALPGPSGEIQYHWRDELGIDTPRPTRAEVDHAYKRMRSKCHPDNGGSDALFHRIQRAYEQACREVA